MPLSGPPNFEKMRAERDVEGLIKALCYEENGDVRQTAATVLGQIGVPRAVKPLIRALQDENQQVRRAVARALVELYSAGTLTAKKKQIILEQRDTIQKHSDYMDIDSCWRRPHKDHHDVGIGVEFPL